MGSPILMLLLIVFSTNGLTSSSDSGKSFSLFNVVTFKNVPCRSSSTTSSSGPRNGTCYTLNGKITVCSIWIVTKVNECCDYVFGFRHFSLQIYAANMCVHFDFWKKFFVEFFNESPYDLGDFAFF